MAPLISYVLVLTGALLISICTGCQTAAFYTQAIGGQSELWKKRSPIELLLKNPATPANLRQRLQLVLELRTFAETNLGLPIRGQYLRYADLQRPFAVWNVYAAPEFSLTPKSWWYPVVGALDYRGYFSEHAARACASRLRAKRFDAHTGGVTAYSTLGWFQDPVLNTFIHDPDSELAELLFHELAHQRLFIPHDTEFNEAFATAVAQEGTRRWLVSRQDTNALVQYDEHLRQTSEFTTLVATTRDRLNNLYTNLPAWLTTLETVQARNQKREILDELRTNYAVLATSNGLAGRYTAWLRQDLNNALLNTIDTYHGLVPIFQHQLTRHSKGDLLRFYRNMESLKRRSKIERRTRLVSEGQSSTELGEDALRQTAPAPLDERPATRE